MSDLEDQNKTEVDNSEDSPVEKQDYSDSNEQSAEVNEQLLNEQLIDSNESETYHDSLESDKKLINLSDINYNLHLINQEINDIKELFTKKSSYNEIQEETISTMHNELQQYKDDMYAKIIIPILKDIIDIRDSILRVSAAYLHKPENEQAIPNKTFAGYALDIQDILERYGVEVYQNEPESAYIPLMQRILKKINTDDESKHGLISESLSSGYLYNGKPISPEKVIVYKYEKTEQTKEDEGSNPQ